MARTAHSAIPEITQADAVSPPALAFKVNMLLRMLADNISRLLGVSGECRMGVGPYRFTGEANFEKAAAFGETIQISGVSDRLGNIHVIRVGSMVEYADDTAAKAGGLKAGEFYRTAAGVVMVVLE